jgi:hypothetical protein
MPTTETPTWWADVQQDREDLTPSGRRPADDWLGEDIDFVPRRRMTYGTPDHPLHGVFVAAPNASTTQTIVLGEPSAREIELEADEPSLGPVDDPYASPPPAPGERRTVQIKGRPEGIRLPSNARRHRPRTAADVVGHRPDRIVLWAVALGAILILLAALTSSSQAAEIGQHAAAAALAR